MEPERVYWLFDAQTQCIPKDSPIYIQPMVETITYELLERPL